MEPIEIKFYDDNDEVTASYTCSRMPTRMVRRAVEIQGMQGVDAAESIDIIADFLVEFFGDRFTRDQLYSGTEASEVMTCYRSIMARIRGIIKGNF